MLPQMLVAKPGYGIVIPGTKESAMALAAARQVLQAQRRVPLASYAQAESASTFYRTPTSVSDALFFSAYWTAVAARLLKSPGLADDASSYQLRAMARAGLPGSTTFFSGSASEIAGYMQEAGRQIQERAGGSPSGDIRAILAILGTKDASDVTNAQGYNVTNVDVAVGTGERIAEDAVSVSEYLRALIPGLEQRGPPPPQWLVWLGRGAIAAVFVGGIAWVMRPYAEATRDATRALRQERDDRRKRLAEDDAGEDRE